MIRYKIDPSATCVVGICREPGCGTRALASSRAEAIDQRDAHEELMHLKRGRQATRRNHSAIRTS